MLDLRTSAGATILTAVFIAVHPAFAGAQVPVEIVSRVEGRATLVQAPRAEPTTLVQPPASAGMMATSSPSSRGVASPSRASIVSLLT